MTRRVAILILLPALFLCRAEGTPADSLPAPRTADDTLHSAPREHAAKSPGLALLASAVLPGAGQVYNESYWKVPVILGFGGYFLSQWLHYNRLASEARDRYRASLLVTPGGDASQELLREFYKEERDTYTWYMLILYLLNAADAYVDAALFDFDVGDDLSLRLAPGREGRVTLTLEFHP